MTLDETKQIYMRMASDAGIVPWTLHQYVGKKRWTPKEEGLEGDMACLMQFAELVAKYECEKAAERAWHALVSKGADWSVRQLVTDAIRTRPT